MKRLKMIINGWYKKEVQKHYKLLKLVDNKKEIFELSRAIHDHGHSYKAGIPRGLDPAMTLGFNYRMSELNAAVGFSRTHTALSIVIVEEQLAPLLIVSEIE